MEEKSRAAWKKYDETHQNIDYGSFGVKVLSNEEIRKLYPNATIDRTPWTEQHRFWLALRNSKAKAAQANKGRGEVYYPEDF